MMAILSLMSHFSIPCPWLCLAAMLVSFLDMVMACWHPAISQPCVGAVHRHPVHSAGDIKKEKKISIFI